MNLKLSLFALLVVFSVMANTSLAWKTFGCGQNGDCWTWCDGGKGWCYTGQSCTNFGQGQTGQCNPDLECKSPRVCSHQW